MTTLSAKTTPRRIHIEAIRILAIFFVLYIHSNERGAEYYPYEPNMTLRWIYLFISQFVQIAVPLFFMISGATLLGKEESKAAVWKNRVLRFLLILIAISIIYGMYQVIIHGWMLSFMDYFTMIYSHIMMYHLWYLYSYIAFLMMLPLLRKLVQNMNNSDFLYLGGIAFVLTCIIPTLEFLLFRDQYSLNGTIQGTLFISINILYPIMGYYIEHVLPKKYQSWKWSVFAILLTGLILCLGAYLTLCRAGYNGASPDEVDAYFIEFPLIPACAVYYCVKLFFSSVQVPHWLSRLLFGMGSTVFGVYMFDHILQEQTIFIYDFLVLYVPSPIASLGPVFCTMFVGMGVVAILKKIPILRLMF